MLVLDHVHLMLMLALRLVAGYGGAERVGRCPLVGIRHLSLKDIITLNA